MAISSDKAALAAGLVLSSTSDTLSNSGKFTLDPFLIRAKRLKRSVLNAANLIQEELDGKGYKCAMLTLTYAPEHDYSPKHITRLLKCIRAYLARLGHPFCYVWVLENTKKGRPHYHVLVWLPKGVTLPKPDKQGWWAWGMTKVEWIRANGAAYIAKYCSKDGQQGEFPKVARLHGCGGLSSSDRWRRSWWNLPAYVREEFPQADFQVSRAAGGGWISRLTGECLDSCFRVESFSPLVVVRL